MSARDYVLVPRSLAERSEAMFRSVDPTGGIAHEWKRALQAAQPCGGEGRSGYRLLSVGETIHDGDEVWCPTGWERVVFGEGELVHEKDKPMRRRCTFTDQSDG